VTNDAKIIVVTGIMGAGKSTIGRLLAGRFERGAHVEADVLHSMIVSGDAWATETTRPGEPLAPEASRQLRLRLRNACVVARNFHGEGITAVVDDIIVGDRWDDLREDLAGQAFYFVVLAPTVEAVIQREVWRGTNLGEDWAYYLDDELRKTMMGVGLWIDSSNQTAEETMDGILRRLEEGLIG
jgi:adenylylsulfate kinase-like enzyme